MKRTHIIDRVLIYSAVVCAALFIFLASSLSVSPRGAIVVRPVEAQCSGGEELIGTSEGGCSESCTAGCEALSDYYYNCYATCGGSDTGGGGTTGSPTPTTCPQSTSETDTTSCGNIIPGSVGTHTVITAYYPYPSCDAQIVGDNYDCSCPDGTHEDVSTGQLTCAPDNTCTFSCDQVSCGTYLQCGQTFNCGTCPITCPAGQHLDNNTCVNDPTPVTCPDAVQEDVGCPDGYAGTKIVETDYYPSPACTAHNTVVENTCEPVITDATMTVAENVGGTWSVSPAGLSGSSGGTYTVYPSSSGTLYTITPGSVSGYYYPPTITNTVTGSGSSYVLYPGQTGGFTLTYTALPPPFLYSISNSGDTTILKGGRDTYGQNTITRTLTSGATQSTSLSITGVPASVDYSVAPQQCNPTCSSTITFTVHPSSVAGTYPITVTASPNNVATSFNLVVQNSPDIIVSCSASPTPAQVGQQVTWTGNVSGGVPPYTYTWTGTNVPTSPAPTTPSFNITYSTVGAKNVQLHVTDSISNTGACDGVLNHNPSGTVQVNFNPQFKEI